MDQLVVLAAQVDDVPTVAQVDEMLNELRGKPKSEVTAKLLDGLLELRAALAA